MRVEWVRGGVSMSVRSMRETDFKKPIFVSCELAVL